MKNILIILILIFSCSLGFTQENRFKKIFDDYNNGVHDTIIFTRSNFSDYLSYCNEKVISGYEITYMLSKKAKKLKHYPYMVSDTILFTDFKYKRKNFDYISVSPVYKRTEEPTFQGYYNWLIKQKNINYDSTGKKIKND